LPFVVPGGEVLAGSHITGLSPEVADLVAGVQKELDAQTASDPPAKEWTGGKGGGHSRRKKRDGFDRRTHRQRPRGNFGRR